MGTRIITIGEATLLACMLFGCDEESTQGPVGEQAPTTTTATTTTDAGGQSTTSAGGEGGESAAGGSGATGGSGGSFACEDDGPGEPNDTPETAVNLLVISDNDPVTPLTFSGVMRGNADVDWYTYLGVDEAGGYVDPELNITLGASYVELCAYFWCVDPGIWAPPGIGGDGSLGTHVCPAGTVEDEVDLTELEHGGVSLGVATGCCTSAGTTGMHLGEDLYETFHALDCAGSTTNDGMKVFLRVSAQAGSEPALCEPYAVAHHF